MRRVDDPRLDETVSVVVVLDLILAPQDRRRCVNHHGRPWPFDGPVGRPDVLMGGDQKTMASSGPTTRMVTYGDLGPWWTPGPGSSVTPRGGTAGRRRWRGRRRS